MRFCGVSLLWLAWAVPSFADGRVGIVNLQQAISETRDAAAARGYLQARFDPVTARLRSEELKLKGEQDRLTINRARSLEWLPWRRRADRKLGRDIDRQTKAYRRHQEDAHAAAAYEQQYLVDAIGLRLQSILAAYANESGYSLVLAGDQPLAASSGVTTEDITKDIVKRYDDLYTATSLDSEGRRINH
jgi:outer membrane protein